MKSILTLLKANIKHKKGAFKSIAALMTIITLSFACTVSNNDNLDKELTASFENTDVGDLLITLGEDDLTDTITDVLDNNSNVSRWRKDELVQVNGSTEVDGNALDSILVLAEIEDNLRVFNDNADGFEKIIPKQGEAYISYSLGAISSIEKGAEIKIPTQNGDELFKVAGFVEDPVYGASTIGCEKFFISKEDFERICSEKLDAPDAAYKYLEKVDMLHIFNSGALSDTQLSSELNNECGIIDKSIRYITKYELTEAIEMYADIGTKILAVYVLLLTIVVIITIHNSISSSVEMEYVNLGILKSQGFTTKHIQLAIFMQYTLALLIGTVLGILISIPLTVIFGKLFINLTGILTHGNASVVKCLLIAIVITVVCAVFIIASTIRIGKISPVKALNGGNDDVYFSGRMNVKIRKRPLMFFVALRQLTSRAGEYVGTCIITALLVFFMISVSAMAKGLSFEALMGNMDSVRVSMLMFDNFKISDMDRVREEVSKECPSAEVFFTSYYDVLADDTIYGITVTDNIELQAKVYDGRTPEYANEIAITEIVANEKGKSIGDTITIHTDHGTEDYLVTGIYQTTSEFGRTFIMDYNAAEKLGIPVMNGMISMEDDPEEIDAMLEMLDESFGDILRSDKYKMSISTAGLISTMNTMLNIIICVVFSISCVFAFLVVTMLCRKAIIHEKRDIGIYKANGFSVDLLRLQFSVRFLIIAVLGSAVGIVLSLMFTRPLFSVILRMVGITNFISEFDFTTLFVPGTVICICFFVFAYISSRKVKTVEVRELISE